MARKIVLILFLIALLVLPTILADTSVITVKTKPYHKLLISVYKAGITPPELITSSKPFKTTGAGGDFKYTLSTGEKKVDLRFDLNKDTTDVVNQDFYGVEVGKPIFINLFPPDNMTITIGEPVVNTTPVQNTTLNETNVSVENLSAKIIETKPIENKTKSNFSITGYASQFYENNSKTIFYIFMIIIAIIIILIIIFIIKKIPKRKHSHMPAPIYHRASNDSSDKSLAEAENKLKTAQEEIEKIKRRNQEIKEAERRMEEDRIRLDRLKRGY